jgi:hypothetical protein
MMMMRMTKKRMMTKTNIAAEEPDAEGMIVTAKMTTKMMRMIVKDVGMVTDITTASAGKIMRTMMTAERTVLTMGAVLVAIDRFHLHTRVVPAIRQEASHQAVASHKAGALKPRARPIHVHLQ